MNKRITAIALSLLMVLTVLASIVPASAYTTAGPVEIRGQVYPVATSVVAWTPANFAGFYYDLNDNVGQESLTATITSGNSIVGSPVPALVYTTTSQPKAFEYSAFGTYNVIGFMAEPYFAGYAAIAAQVEASTKETNTNRNILDNDDLSKVLIDSDEKYTIATGDGLELKEGYVLNVQQVDLDGSKALFELTKDGKVVDTEVVYPGQAVGANDDIYVYDEAKLGEKDKYPLIIARVDTVFRGTDTNVVTIEGLFQISDSITTVEKVEPGTYEIRGQVYPVVNSVVTWTPANFAGFYYDLNDNVGQESITATITSGNSIIGSPAALTYATTSQPKTFEYSAFGTYNVIGFMAEPYFAGYAAIAAQVEASTKETT